MPESLVFWAFWICIDVCQPAHLDSTAVYCWIYDAKGEVAQSFFYPRRRRMMIFAAWHVCRAIIFSVRMYV
jgi:hypothetical protein